MPSNNISANRIRAPKKVNTHTDRETEKETEKVREKETAALLGFGKKKIKIKFCNLPANYLFKIKLKINFTTRTNRESLAKKVRQSFRLSTLVFHFPGNGGGGGKPGRRSSGAVNAFPFLCVSLSGSKGSYKIFRSIQNGAAARKFN